MTEGVDDFPPWNPHEAGWGDVDARECSVVKHGRAIVDGRLLLTSGSYMKERVRVSNIVELQLPEKGRLRRAWTNETSSVAAKRLFARVHYFLAVRAPGGSKTARLAVADLYWAKDECPRQGGRLFRVADLGAPEYSSYPVDMRRIEHKALLVDSGHGAARHLVTYDVAQLPDDEEDGDA